MLNDNNNTNEQIILAHERTDLASERNRLASIRTFLAWTRTGLASVGGGLAVIRFLLFSNTTHEIVAQIVGCILVFLGILIFLFSFLDYRKNMITFKLKDRYAGSIAFGLIITIILVSISIALLFIASNIPVVF
jgi:putative membrane protein